MKNKLILTNINQMIIIIGIIAIVSYFLHVILGSMNYPGYNPLSQAVSDLTSDESPSKDIARLFSSLYGIFSSLLSILLIIIYQKEKNRRLKYGIILLSIMYITSAIGYAFFPLSSQDMGEFQNVMHLVITMIVVLLTIAGMIFLMIAFYKMQLKMFFLLTVTAFILLLFGAVLTGIIPKEYFGVAERFSVYTVVLYVGVITYFNLVYQQMKKLIKPTTD